MASTHKPIVAALVSACVSAFLILQPATSSAVTTTGYEAFGDTAGVVLWRADASRDTLFHTSTVADVAADGTIGTAYAMTADSSAKSWKRFASNQTNYSAPGMLLVFDAADDGNGNNYTTSTDAQFAPLSFGGLWVKSLASDGTPFTITDYKTDGSDRKVELGASGYSTLFKFDVSFTFNRNSAVEVKGTGTVEIASLATFTINGRENKGAKVDSGNTLVLTGAGELAVTGGLAVGGTLDISAAPVPTITGDVTLAADSTIVLPSGTAVGSAVNILVCNGTLAVGGPVYVKIGTADPVSATLTVSNGMITLIETTSTYTATISGDTAFSAIQWQKNGASATISSMETAILEISGSGTVTGLAETPAGITLVDSSVVLDATSVPSIDSVAKNGNGTFLFTANYPQTVPAGLNYVYQGGTDVATSANNVAVAGYLKTSGKIAITGMVVNRGATHEVVSGETTVTAATNGYGDKLITGNLKIDAGATYIATQTDQLDYYNANGQTVDVYGTLALGAYRWTIENSTKCIFNLYPGAQVTGSGDVHGALDLCAATSKLNVYSGDNGGEINIEGVLRTRNANTPIWVAANTTLKLSGGMKGGINKSGDGAIQVTGAIANAMASTVSEGTFAFVNATNALPLTVNAGKTVVASASEGVTVPLNVTMNASANITVSGAGVVNGTVAFGAKPTGTLTGLTTSTWQGTVSIAALSAPGDLSVLVNCGNEDSVISLAGISGSSYIIASGGKTYNVGGVSIDGYTEFNNGSSASIVNFAKISGTADLKLVGWSGCSSARYNLNKIEGYSGTLSVSNAINRTGGGTFTIGIGNIVNASAASGVCILPITSESMENPTGSVVYNLDNALVNGTSTNLCYATVNNVSGVYIAAAKIGSTYYPTLTDAVNARRAGARGSIEVLDGTAAIPEGYIVDGGKLVRRAFLINIK